MYLTHNIGSASALPIISPILARQWWRHFRLWWPLREGRDGKCEGGNDKCEFLARENANLLPILARQLWRHFRLTTSVSLLPSHYFRLTTPVCLSLSPIVPHAQYRKRFRASYNKVRTLFLSRRVSRNISIISMMRRLVRWRGLPRLHASLASTSRSAMKLDFSISHDRNSVLI